MSQRSLEAVVTNPRWSPLDKIVSEADFGTSEPDSYGEPVYATQRTLPLSGDKTAWFVVGKKSHTAHEGPMTEGEARARVKTIMDKRTEQ